MWQCCSSYGEECVGMDFGGLGLDSGLKTKNFINHYTSQFLLFRVTSRGGRIQFDAAEEAIELVALAYSIQIIKLRNFFRWVRNIAGEILYWALYFASFFFFFLAAVDSQELKTCQLV